MKFNEVANHSMNSIGDSNNSTNAFDDSNDNSSIVGHPQQSSLNNPNVMPPVGSAGMVLNPEQQPVKIEKDLSTNKHQHDDGGGGGGADHEIMDVLMNMSKIQWKNNSTTTAGSGGGKRYSCKLCEKSYKGKQGLDSHINSVHRGVKSFSCQLCHNKSYTQSHSLKQHIKTGGYIFYRYKHLIFHKNFIVHLNFIFLQFMKESKLKNFTNVFHVTSHIPRAIASNITYVWYMEDNFMSANGVTKLILIMEGTEVTLVLFMKDQKDFIGVNLVEKLIPNHIA